MGDKMMSQAQGDTCEIIMPQDDDDPENEGRPKEPKLHPWVHRSMYKWFTIMAFGTIFICVGIFWVYVPLPVASVSLALAAVFFSLGMLFIAVALHMMRTTIRKIVQGKRLAIKISKEVKMSGTAILPVMLPPEIDKNSSHSRKSSRRSSKERKRRRREKRYSSSASRKDSNTLQVPTTSRRSSRHSSPERRDSIFAISSPSNESVAAATNYCPPLCAPEVSMSPNEKVAQFLEVSSQPNLTSTGKLPLQQSMSTPILAEVEVAPQPVPQQDKNSAVYSRLDPRAFLKDFQFRPKFTKNKSHHKSSSGLSMITSGRSKEKLCAKRSVQSETGIMMANSFSSTIENTLLRTPEFHKRSKRSNSDVSFVSAYEYLPQELLHPNGSTSFGSFDKTSIRTFASNHEFSGSALSISSVSMASGYVTPPTEFSPIMWAKFDKSISRRHDIDTSGTSLSSTPPSVPEMPSSSWQQIAYSDDGIRPMGEKSLHPMLAESESCSSGFDVDLSSVMEEGFQEESKQEIEITKDGQDVLNLKDKPVYHLGVEASQDELSSGRSRDSTITMIDGSTGDHINKGTSDSSETDGFSEQNSATVKCRGDILMKHTNKTEVSENDSVSSIDGTDADTHDSEKSMSNTDSTKFQPRKPLKFSRFTVHPVSEEALRTGSYIPLHRTVSLIDEVLRSSRNVQKFTKEPALRTHSTLDVHSPRNMQTNDTSNSDIPNKTLNPESRKRTILDLTGIEESPILSRESRTLENKASSVGMKGKDIDISPDCHQENLEDPVFCSDIRGYNGDRGRSSDLIFLSGKLEEECLPNDNKLLTESVRPEKKFDNILSENNGVPRVQDADETRSFPSAAEKSLYSPDESRPHDFERQPQQQRNKESDKNTDNNTTKIIVPIASISEIDELLDEALDAEDVKQELTVPGDNQIVSAHGNLKTLDLKSTLSETHAKTLITPDDSVDSGRGSDLMSPNDTPSGRHEDYIRDFNEERYSSGDVEQSDTQFQDKIDEKYEGNSNNDFGCKGDMFICTLKDDDDNMTFDIQIGDETKQNSNRMSFSGESRSRNPADSRNRTSSLTPLRNNEFRSVLSTESLLARRKSDSAMNRRTCSDGFKTPENTIYPELPTWCLPN